MIAADKVTRVVIDKLFDGGGLDAGRNTQSRSIDLDIEHAAAPYQWDAVGKSSLCPLAL